MVQKAKPEGEIVFERYLTENGLGWEYEPLIGSKHPDYLVHGKVKVLCEVEDFAGSDHERQVLAQIKAGASQAGVWDPIGYVNNAIRSAAKQLRPGKGEYPCVAILYNDATMPYEHELFITQAMFGRLQISQLVGPMGAMSEAVTEYSRQERYLTRNCNTTISAVALIEEFKPNIHILRDEESAILDRMRAEEPGDGPWGSLAAVSEGLTRALPLLKKLRTDLDDKLGPGFIDEVHPRLRIYHNPWAAMKLPLEALGGKHDEHLLYDLESRRFTRPYL